MNTEQINLIKSSWSKALPIAETAAEQFYDHLSEVAPEVRELLPADVSGQKKALKALLGRVVAALDDLDRLVPMVQELAVRYLDHGAKAAHYPVVGEALLWTLEQGLGEEWNDELKDAWAAAYGVLSSTMIDAANAHVEESRKLEEEAEAKAREEAEARARIESEEVEAIAREEAETKARIETEEAEAKAKEEAEAEAELEAEEEPLAKTDEEIEAEAKANRTADRRAKRLAKRGGTGSVAAAMTVEQKNNMAEQASGPHRQLVVFDLDTELYGLDINDVREIIRLQEITVVPRTPEFVEGVINLRGKIIPVLDLRRRFGMEAAERDEDFRIVVVDVNGTEIGMIVDAVTEVSRVPESGIEPTTAVIAGDDSEYLTGIAKTGDEMIILLDIGKLISDRQLTEVTETVSEEKQAA